MDGEMDTLLVLISEIPDLTLIPHLMEGSNKVREILDEKN